MKKYNLTLGMIIASLLAIAILPIRLSEGQGNNPYNLIGSEIGLWTMCLTAWCAAYHIQFGSKLRKWQKIGLSLVVCAVLSNLFYYTFNPLFEDYPLSPLREYPLGIAVLRLSLRGLLMGLIIVPIAFLFENERQLHQAELDAQKQHLRASREQNHLLEKIVSERTQSLEDTLSSLRKSQSELDNQVYVLSHLVASVTHDVSSPLNYLIIAAKKVDQLLESGCSAEAVKYNQELLKTLTSMSTFMGNLLEFTKTQVRRESIQLSEVNISALIREKVSLFEGIVNSKKNTLRLHIDQGLTVNTNYNLLAVILHNLLDNAARYTLNGVISIKMEITDKKPRLIIENTVKTLPEPFLAHADDYQYPQHWQASKPEENQGIGLILVRNIAALLRIDFFTEASSDKAIAQLIFND